MEALFSTGERKITFLVSTVLVVALTFLYQTWRRSMERRAFKIRHGCKDPPRYPHRDQRWGSDLARVRMDAMKNGRLFELYFSQFELYGKTFEENWKGQKLINTMEPTNIRQITTIAFGDYCKDPGRARAQAPFLGPSIFSDGPIWEQARALVNPTFARAEIADLDHLASFADKFMELIPDDGSTVDMQPLLHRLVRMLLFQISQ